MRRAFTLQMESVPAAMRLPQKPSKPPDATRDQKRQILFTNLRRRVIVDGEFPVAEQGRYDGDLDLNQRFLADWLEDARMPSDTWMTATAVVSCACNACSDARKPIGGGLMYPSSAYHMHWRVGSISKSVGIVCTMPELVVDRDWGPPDTMLTRDDYQFAMGMALDDALHDCAIKRQGDSQLKRGIIDRVRSMLGPRMPTQIVLGKVSASITNFANTATIKVAADIDGGIQETMVAQRILRTGDL